MTSEMASDIFKNVLSSSPSKQGKNIAALADEDVHTVRYWLYAPGEGSCMWDEFYTSGIMAIGWGEIGDLSTFDSIIGMMNTADRSLAMLDYALRRRFAFFEIKPGFTTDGFREYRMSLENEKFDKLIACVESLNNVISNDESLGDGFCIGHSYFCNLLPDTIDDQVLSGIVEYELIPLLKEYWFDEPTKVKDWSSNLRSAIK